MMDRRIVYNCVTRTDAGNVRKLNEDSLLSRSDIGLWLVADGMGGHDAGDFASQAIVAELEHADPGDDMAQFEEDVRRRILDANDFLIRTAEAATPPKTIGSTVVSLLVSQQRFACVWAGDSRLYRYRGAQLEQVSKDHSLVQQLVDAGALRADEAESHPQANVITRAVGANRDLEIDCVKGAVQDWDIFLVCSDGLTKMVSDADIATALSLPNLDASADALLDLALANGGRDNVTLILVEAVPVNDAVIDEYEDDTVSGSRST